MTGDRHAAVTEQLTLPDELVLTLLNEESGYFRQVSGWKLNCAVVGSVIAELSLIDRIDTDMESLILLDSTPTGDPCLDPCLAEIAMESRPRNAQYWVERLAPRAEKIIDTVLERLVRRNILQHHEGDYWSLAQGAWRSGFTAHSDVGTPVEFVKTRISRAIFTDEIPDPRDVIVICVVDACDVLTDIFDIEEEFGERVAQITKMDLIGRAIADAVGDNIARPVRPTALAKPIPVVKRRKLLRSEHFRARNIPAVFAELYEEYGPVFQVKVPFREPMIFLAGPEANHWMHREGRTYLRSRDYFESFEKVYGGVGLLPGLDGADHFRYRKTVQTGYSRARLTEQLDETFAHARNHMATLPVGEKTSAISMSRHMINSQLSPLLVNIESNDVIDDLCIFKKRALNAHLARAVPKFMLKTPGMRRRAKIIEDVVEQVKRVHTPAQRVGCPRNLSDELLSMHANDRQFLPESNLPFVLTSPLLAAMYSGDQLSFILHHLLSQPEFYDRVQSEADAVFADGDPDMETLTGPATSVSRRFIMECLRLSPIIPMSIRNVMNACVIGDYELPEGSRVHIATTATHYLSEVFPDPHTFDVDRYLAPRKEHLGTGYAPYGLGTHSCLGSRLAETQILINMLMLAHYFTMEIAQKNTKLKISALPTMSPSKKLKFRITEQRRELPA